MFIHYYVDPCSIVWYSCEHAWWITWHHTPACYARKHPAACSVSTCHGTTTVTLYRHINHYITYIYIIIKHNCMYTPCMPRYARTKPLVASLHAFGSPSDHCYCPVYIDRYIIISQTSTSLWNIHTYTPCRDPIPQNPASCSIYTCNRTTTVTLCE